MFRKFAGLACALLLSVPLVATAAPVTWNFSGGLTTVTNFPTPPPFVSVGSPFDLSLTFDPSAFSLAPNLTCITGAPGQVGGCFQRYQVLPGTTTDTIGLTLDFGVDCDDSTPAYDKCGPDSGGTGVILKFDDFNDGTSTYDGLRFAIFRNNGMERWLFNLVGPTSIFTSSIGLPSAPSAGFTSGTLEICDGSVTMNAFSTCDRSALRVVGAVATPEPATLALLVAGLAGVGLARRRRGVA